MSNGMGFRGRGIGLIASGLLGAGVLCIGAAPAHAAVNLVTNGNFTATTTSSGAAGTSSYQLYSPNDTSGYSVTGWTNTGYGFVETPGSADTTGAYSPQFNNTFYVWGPEGGTSSPYYSNNGYTSTSPAGGNYIIEDADSSYSGKLSQTLTGLTVGSGYDLSFYWAAAQQGGYSGLTTESWTVGFTDPNGKGYTVTTPTANTGNHGFTPWALQTFSFIATSTTETISFLAMGTPNGVPPLALLDGVSLVATPEPSTLAVLGAGLLGLIAARRRTRRGSTAGKTAA